MKLTAEQQARALECVRKFQPIVCSVCKHRDWDLQDNYFRIREFEKEDPDSKSAIVLPAIALTCRTCGNTLLLNAIVLGLLTPKTQAEVVSALPESDR